MEKKRCLRAARALSTLLLAGALCAVLALLLFAFPHVQFDRKREAFGSLIPLAALGLAAALAGAWAVRKAARRVLCGRRLCAPVLAAGCAALFCVQAFLWFHAYFIAGWDLVSILKSAYAIAGGDELIDNYYLSLYPNNAMLTLIFGWIMRAFRMLTGGARLDRCVFVLILLQCALNAAACYLTARVAQVGLRSDLAGLAAFIGYAAFTGISPWMIVPYSDSMALIVPVGILRLYQLSAQGKRRRWVWPCIGLLTFVGWSLKPQAVIVTIAVLLLFGARCVSEQRLPGYLAEAVCVVAIAAVGIGPVSDAILDASPIELREGKSIGALHYVMMGLNPESNGVYRDEDMILSASAPDPASRRAAQWARLCERVSAMDAGDWANHLAKKALSNFADAPVIWSVGGVTCWQTIADKDGVISPFLKGLLGVENGTMFSPLYTYFECVWLALLMLALAGCVASRRLLRAGREEDWRFAAMLAVFGFMLFQMIFEAGNRYFMIYTPFVVLLATAGLQAIFRAAGRRRRA